MKNEKIKIGYNKLFEIQKICLRVSEFGQKIQKQNPILIKSTNFLYNIKLTWS